MTTRNIRLTDGEEDYGAEEIIADLGRLGDAAKRRAERVRKEMESVDKKRRNVGIGARVVERKLMDDEEGLTHEADQLSWILREDSDVELIEPEPAAPAEEPVSSPTTVDELINGLYTRSQLEGMTNDRLVQIANGAYSMDMNIYNFNRETAIDRILRAQHRWCVENEVEDPNVGETSRLNRVTSVRNWSGVQWLLAFIGAVIALIIAVNTMGFMDDIEGLARGVLKTIWVFVVTMTGFFGGGFIGSFIDLDDNDD